MTPLHEARTASADRAESAIEHQPSRHTVGTHKTVTARTKPTTDAGQPARTVRNRSGENEVAYRLRVRNEADAVRATWAEQNRPHAALSDDKLAQELAVARDQLTELIRQRDRDQQAHDRTTAGYSDGHGPRETELLREAEHDNHRAALVEQARTIEKALKQAKRHHEGATFAASEHGNRARGARFYQHRTRNRALDAQAASELEAADAARHVEREHAALVDTFTELGISPIHDNPSVRSTSLDAVERDIQRNRNNNESYRLSQAREYDGDDLRCATNRLNRSTSAVTRAEHTITGLTAEVDTREGWDSQTRHAAGADRFKVTRDNLLTSIDKLQAQQAEQAREADQARQAKPARRSHTDPLDYEYTGYRTDPMGHSQGHGLGR